MSMQLNPNSIWVYTWLLMGSGTGSGSGIGPGSQTPSIPIFQRTPIRLQWSSMASEHQMNLGLHPISISFYRSRVPDSTLPIYTHLCGAKHMLTLSIVFLSYLLRHSITYSSSRCIFGFIIRLWVVWLSGYLTILWLAVHYTQVEWE